MTKTNMPKVVVSKSNFPPEAFIMGHELSGEVKPCPVNVAIANSFLSGEELEKAQDWIRLTPAAYKKKYGSPVKPKEQKQEENG